MIAPPSQPQPSQVSRSRRVFYAFSLIALVIVLGTVGFHQIEGMNWVNAFYFESMLATGQGPPLTLQTAAGKIFASVMGFVSLGSVITAFAVTLVPLISQLWRESVDRLEREAKTLESDLERKKKPQE